MAEAQKTLQDATSIGDRLAPGKALDGATQYLQSANGQNQLLADSAIGLTVLSGAGGIELITDDDLILVPDPNAALRLNMQTDGNLVLYANGKAIFASHTQGNPGAFAVMQNDGNVVVYSAAGAALWASYTYDTYGFSYNYQGDSSEGLLRAGWSLVSPNLGYRLIMQSDGNLVLYSTKRALWSSQTQGNPGAFFKIQGDGNLVVYSSAGKALWASMTFRTNRFFALEPLDNGNLTLTAFNPDTGRSVVTWSTRTAGKK